MIAQRGNRSLRDESDQKFLAKSPRVSSDVALKDHDYIFSCKDNKVLANKKTNTVKMSVSVPAKRTLIN